MRIRKEIFLNVLVEEKNVIDRLKGSKLVTVVQDEAGRMIVGRWGTNKTTLKKMLKEA